MMREDLGVVVHTYNPNTLETATGKGQVQGQLGIYKKKINKQMGERDGSVVKNCLLLLQKP